MTSVHETGSSGIEITLMGGFTVTVDGQRVEKQIGRSYKGVLLMQILMAYCGEAVSCKRLWQALWPDDEKHANPENALKTLVSRLRVQVSRISPTLAGCIVTERGGYRWQSAPGVQVDVIEISRLLNQMEGMPPAQALESGMYERLMTLYKGELLQGESASALLQAQGSYLHTRYIEVMERCMEELSNRGEYEQVMDICKRVILVEKLNEQVYIELMKAMVRLGRVNEAIAHYRHVERLFYSYLGIRPSEEMQAFYKTLGVQGRGNGVNLSAIQAELQEEDPAPGAYVCDYVVFREGYKILMRNVDRTMCDVCLAAITVKRNDGRQMELSELDRSMTALITMMHDYMRRGDIISRYGTDVVIALLPATSPDAAEKLIEKVQTAFYRGHPQSGWTVTARISVVLSKI